MKLLVCRGVHRVTDLEKMRVVFGNVHQGDFVVLWSVSQETSSVV